MARNYMFTKYDLNMENICYDDVQYMVYQHEICPTTGKSHLQGYIELKKTYRIKGLKTNVFLDNSIHLEARKGTRDDAITYCTKTETRKEGCTPFFFGSSARQGTRNDIKDVYDMVKAGNSDFEIQEKYTNTYVRYFKGIDRLRLNLYEEKSHTMRDVKCYVIWGKPGSGKTRSVYDKFDSKDVYNLTLKDPLWFDGYKCQKVLLIDDFYGNIRYSMMLNILDRYPLRLPVKGSYALALWDTVFITSNKPPNEWYRDEINIDALLRRFTTVSKCDEVDG